MTIQTWTLEFYSTPASEVPPEDALKHSLQKWEGLTQENLDKHGLRVRFGDLRDDYGEEFEMHSGTCALCENHSCRTCPLTQSLGNTCAGTDTSPFNLWTRNTNPQPPTNDQRSKTCH